MDKKELIGFILNDIKELEFIAKGMHEMDKIPEIMQELAESKTSNILDKFRQLKEEPKEETLPDIVEPIESVELIEPVEEKESLSISQNTEPPKEEKTIFQPLLLFAEEEILTVADQQPEEVDPQPEEETQPEEEIQQPEEGKGTIIVQEEKKVQERTTNEKFKFRIPVVNPAATTAGRRIESRFIQNLRKAINLNDRFRYQKELFGGNVELMNRTIDKLDTMESLDEAMTYVQQEFAWDAESGTVADFYLLLESRFS